MLPLPEYHVHLYLYLYLLLFPLLLFFVAFGGATA